MALRDKIRNGVFFLISRYPFVNAISFLMLLAERAKREKTPPLDPYLIYANLVVFIVCGLCTSFDMKRRQAALFNSAQLVLLSAFIYTAEKMKYNEWILIRMCSRLLGTAGMMTLYSFYHAKKPRPQHHRRVGETLIGLYFFCVFYSVLYSKEETQALFAHMPGGITTQYLMATLAALGALAFISSYYIIDISYTLIIYLSITTLMIDGDMEYWTGRRGMDFWNQFRLLSDNLYIICALIMTVVCSTRSLSKAAQPKPAQEHHQKVN